LKLFLMSLATVAFPPDGERRTLPIPWYLIQTESGEYLLVDTGLSRRVIDAIDASPPPFQMEEEQDIVHQLARLGLSPADIGTVICSHFDPDHSGNLEAFPTARIIVQRSHYQAALQGDPRLALVRDQWDAPGRQILLVDGDTELVPGVTLIESSGHAPGHQSVLVQLQKTGPVLLPIDAIPFQIQLDPERRLIEPMDMDAEGVRASTRKLVKLAKQAGCSLVIYGHDPEQWQHLQLLPHYYD
jgi:N-acyl homoserine lactone hydrolase